MQDAFSKNQGLAIQQDARPPVCSEALKQWGQTPAFKHTAMRYGRKYAQ